MAKFTSKYVPDNASMGAFLLSGQVSKVSAQAGKDVADDARDDALRHSRTGSLAAAFHSRPIIAGEGLEGGPRIAAEVYNNARHAATVEFGGPNNPARHHLTKAGLRRHVPLVRRGGKP